MRPGLPGWVHRILQESGDRSQCDGGNGFVLAGRVFLVDQQDDGLNQLRGDTFGIFAHCFIFAFPGGLRHSLTSAASLVRVRTFSG